jgi:hypothetical protein
LITPHKQLDALLTMQHDAMVSADDVVEQVRRNAEDQLRFLVEHRDESLVTIRAPAATCRSTSSPTFTANSRYGSRACDAAQEQMLIVGTQNIDGVGCSADDVWRPSPSRLTEVNFLTSPQERHEL